MGEQGEASSPLVIGGHWLTRRCA